MFYFYQWFSNAKNHATSKRRKLQTTNQWKKQSLTIGNNSRVQQSTHVSQIEKKSGSGMEAILETTGNKQFGALLFSRSRVKYSNGPLRIQTAHFSRLEQPRRERERERGAAVVVRPVPGSSLELSGKFWNTIDGSFCITLVDQTSGGQCFPARKRARMRNAFSLFATKKPKSPSLLFSR